MKPIISSRKAHAARWGEVLAVVLNLPHQVNLQAHDRRHATRTDKEHGGTHE